MVMTKILATVGPATSSEEVARKLIDEGLDGIRLNMSHGTHEEHAQLLSTYRSLKDDLFIMVDVKGRKLRLGDFGEGRSVSPGDEVVIDSSLDPFDPGNASRREIPIQIESFPVKEGDTILLSDGEVCLSVKHIEGSRVITEVVFGTSIESRKGVSVPGVELPLPFLSDDDIRAIEFAKTHDVDYIALSFVTSRKEVEEARKLVGDSKTLLISKIESALAVPNFDEIMEASDGILIARGDLGVELPIEDVPGRQKDMISKANIAGKPAIVATQMLESMRWNARPTRAEVNDVYNAALDGADCVMLSAETSIGRYPAESVRIMNTIVLRAQHRIRGRLEKVDEHQVVNMVTNAVVDAASHSVIKGIVCLTRSGYTARMISRFRPSKMILAATWDRKVRNQLGLVWGVYPFMFEGEGDISRVCRLAKDKDYLQDGDLIVAAAGVGPTGEGTTNLMRIERV